MSTFETPTKTKRSKTAITGQIFNSNQESVVEPCNETHRRRITRGFNQALVHLERSRLPSTPTTRVRIHRMHVLRQHVRLGQKRQWQWWRIVRNQRKGTSQGNGNEKKRETAKRERVSEGENDAARKMKCFTAEAFTKGRQRAEIYAINRILKQRFDEKYNRFLDKDGGNSIAFHTSV